LKYYNKAEQKPSMRIYNGEFLSCEITESGLHEDSLWTGSDWGKTFEGKYDSDLVICGGRFSDNPTATIDPKSKVYYNSNSGVLYKYRVFEPNLFMIKIR
jgi:hypothetical protein